MTALRFSAVVGQEQAKAALLMVAVNPRLGGVLLRGDKGSAKTTLARGLAALLPNDAPFVELPLGATEDRVIGSLDIAALLTDGEPRFRPGLLAAAHGGVLYVDEINLLADHLVDTLLDVSVSGVNRVERDGMSHSHPARFVLVASMNPEEGELRPQLLDRFGLAVDVIAPARAGDRVEAVRRQLATELRHHDGDVFHDDDRRIRESLVAARTVDVNLPGEIAEIASHLALEVGAEGLRADLMLCRAATANAALQGHETVTADDVRAVAEMVLAHRRRRQPFDQPGIGSDEMNDAWQGALEASQPGDCPNEPPTAAPGDRLDQADSTTSVQLPDRQRPTNANGASGRFGTERAPRGRLVRDVPLDPSSIGGIGGRATAIALASRRASTGDKSAPVIADDLRGSHREQRAGALVIFVVDASGSMGIEHRMAATKAAVLGLLGDAYRRRGRVALVTFRDSRAEVILRPTASIEIANARLQNIRTGGTSPLAAGVDAARAVLGGATGDRAFDPTVVIVTDGRVTEASGIPGRDPLAAARDAMHRLAATGARIILVDTETGLAKLGLVADLAADVGADYVALGNNPSSVEHAVRSLSRL